ncbi:hypothetical protein KIPB_004203 [Kipferlia bialata]|uniref:Uncharacterized protein n=1 Tax=Kipferlia bialata TaxID=797122 RepID=A0A9K3CTG8_9EUKA|nr:hypothetical protein KIPB_004203 [Kipferlia bialata]|eukprot:g4203.t1
MCITMAVTLVYDYMTDSYDWSDPYTVLETNATLAWLTGGFTAYVPVTTISHFLSLSISLSLSPLPTPILPGGFTAYVPVIMSMVYVQVFRGVIKPRTYSAVFSVGVVCSIVIVILGLLNYGNEYKYNMEMYALGRETFYYDGYVYLWEDHMDVINVRYGLIILLAICQMIVIVMRGMAKLTANQGPRQQKKRCHVIIFILFLSLFIYIYVCVCVCVLPSVSHPAT